MIAELIRLTNLEIQGCSDVFFLHFCQTFSFHTEAKIRRAVGIDSRHNNFVNVLVCVCVCKIFMCHSFNMLLF